MKYKTVGIIGAGIAGLVCADRLQREGIAVTILEKSRGVGGRSATRRLEEGSCDHGAQYFTVSDPLFAGRVAEWRARGIVDVWQGRIVAIDDGVVRELNEPRERLVGTPGMNSIGKFLASGVNVRSNVEVVRIERAGQQWRVVDQSEELYGPFDALISTAPPIQTARLFSGASVSLTEQIERVVMRPCWSVMLSFSSRLEIEFDGAFVNGGPLSWIARNNSKPGRGAEECWVLHASADWSTAHLEDEADDVGPALTNEFWRLFGRGLSSPSHVVSHRWRYAIPQNVLPTRYVFDDELRLGIAGDWCGGPRIEGAFLSGHALGNHLLETEK